MSAEELEQCNFLKIYWCPGGLVSSLIQEKSKTQNGLDRIRIHFMVFTGFVINCLLTPSSIKISLPFCETLQVKQRIFRWRVKFQYLFGSLISVSILLQRSVINDFHRPNGIKLWCRSN